MEGGLQKSSVSFYVSTRSKNKERGNRFGFGEDTEFSRKNREKKQKNRRSGGETMKKGETKPMKQ